MKPAFKSSEHTPTVPDFVDIPLYLIKFVGAKLFKWTPNEPTSKSRIIFMVIYFGFTIYNFTSMMLYVIYEELNDLLDLTEFILFWGFSLNAMMKGCTMVYYRHEIETILQGLIARHPKTKEERVEFQLMSYYKTINASNKYLSIWHLTIATMFVFQPMLTSIYGYINRVDENEDFDYTLPFMMSYYYNTNRPFPYAISYFLQCGSAYHMSLLFLSGDLLLISMVQLVNMHLEYLIYRIENFKPNGTDADMKVLGPLLEYHNEILDYTERIDNTFSLATLLNYGGTCLVLCLIGLQIVLGTEALSLIKFIGFLVSTIVQMFLVSYFGNNLKDLVIHIHTYISDKDNFEI
ncbi:odorant receptor 67c-like [Zeugodacus cucurbitae]|uniref:odorant receptor 67c-like n=1 Tax=Zeugodacus cucurbitae TaxID=28588 RepID=UPI0023D8E3EA|nr:odorant receptor 67c-like [Zeugodacus cucurbitae]